MIALELIRSRNHNYDNAQRCHSLPELLRYSEQWEIRRDT